MAITLDGSNGVTTPDLTVDTDTLTVDTTNNRVGIGTSSPAYKFQIAAGTDHLITKAASNLNSNIFFDTQNTSTGASANIVQRLITSNVAGTGTTSVDFQKTKAGALNINNNETNSAAYTRFGVGGSEVMRIDSSGNLKFNSGYGSAATAYGCRAWINFNGVGVVAIRASGNVSSIVDSGVGIYTINFTTAMPDTNYAVVGGGYQIGNHPTTSFAVSSAVPMATTSVRVNFGTTGGSGSVGFTNDGAATVASIAIFR